MPKPLKAVRLSAHANLCANLGVASLPMEKGLDRILEQLTHLKVPPIERLGPAPSAESIWNELRARAARKSKAKRRTSDPERFLRWAWNAADADTRASLIASTAVAEDDFCRGDLKTREFAREVLRSIHSLDRESFLDEIFRF